MDKVEKRLDVEQSTSHPQLYNVVWRGGPGKVPNQLSGLWSKGAAIKAIEQYVESKK